MIETLVTAPIPGGGRSYDRVFPAFQLRNVGNSAAFYTQYRQGFVTDTNWTSVGIGFVVSGFELYKGRVAYKLGGGGGTGEVQVNSARFGVFTTAGGAQQKGDFHCWRILLIAATTVVGAGDLGIQLTIGSSGDTVVNAAALGFGLQITGQTSATFITRNGGALTSDLMANDLDTREYNAYELRVCSSTRTADGYVRALVNGKNQRVYRWGAGTLLPTSVNTANCTLGVCITNRNATAPGLYVPVGGCHITAGPTEQATL
jgi:hypothetical protein